MISIVIPTFNEENQIVETLSAIFANARSEDLTEVIVCDGGSTDRTVEIAAQAGARTLNSPRKGRAAQMNYAAAQADGEILYFLHADTIPPTNFTAEIIRAFSAGKKAGCFTLAFDHEHWFLKANCWFTRFDVDYFRFGDQSLFISRENFSMINGFREDHVVMEDQEIIKRIRQISPFTIIKKPVTTSARKYLENGIYRTQALFFLIFFMYKLGFDQQQLVSTYKRRFRQDKV